MSKPNLWERKTSRSCVVDVWGEAELRIGEMREKCTVYERNGKLYVRRTPEFVDKFKKIDG